MGLSRIFRSGETNCLRAKFIEMSTDVGVFSSLHRRLGAELNRLNVDSLTTLCTL